MMFGRIVVVDADGGERRHGLAREGVLGTGRGAEGGGTRGQAGCGGTLRLVALTIAIGRGGLARHAAIVGILCVDHRNGRYIASTRGGPDAFRGGRGFGKREEVVGRRFVRR